MTYFSKTTVPQIKENWGDYKIELKGKANGKVAK